MQNINNYYEEDEEEEEIDPGDIRIIEEEFSDDYEPDITGIIYFNAFRNKGIRN